MNRNPNRISQAILIVVALVGLTISVKAQTKIGELTVSDSTAKKYFLDCYNHPDTIKERSSHDYGIPDCSGCSFNYNDFTNAEREAKDYNSQLKNNSIGKVTHVVNVPARIDTSYYFNSFVSNKHLKQKPLITHREAYSYIEFVGWLIPRKPAEQDFIKWYAKINSK